MSAAELRALLGLAYADDPLSRWIFPDDGSRAEACAAWYGLFAEAYLASGRVHAVHDGAAACLWRMPDDRPLQWPELPTPAGLLRALAGPEHARVVAESLHRVSTLLPDEPSVYVNFLAVRPAAQGRGLGARALAAPLRAAEEAGLGVHLETSNPRNHRFYARHGFVPAGTCAMTGGPTLQALRRPAVSR